MSDEIDGAPTYNLDGYQSFLGDIADKWFRLMRRVTVRWSAFCCLSRSCIVLKRQKISTGFFCIQQPLVSPRSC